MIAKDIDNRTLKAVSFVWKETRMTETCLGVYVSADEVESWLKSNTSFGESELR